VLFRGYPVTPEVLDAFARPFTREYFYGYGRAPFGALPAITTVNESQLALEPHCDNGIRPESMRPQITWFWCEQPAEADGETTFFDGVEVWSRLSDQTRAVFRARQVSFLSRVAEPAWRALGHRDVDSFLRFLTSLGAHARAVDAGQTVDVEIRSAAVRTPQWIARDAFVSSMLIAGSRGFEGMRVTFDDGSSIPPGVHDDVRAALAACLTMISWRPGDVCMLDNTRFLHGRRAFTDPARRLYLIQTLHASF